MITVFKFDYTLVLKIIAIQYKKNRFSNIKNLLVVVPLVDAGVWCSDPMAKTMEPSPTLAVQRRETDLYLPLPHYGVS